MLFHFEIRHRILTERCPKNKMLPAIDVEDTIVLLKHILARAPTFSLHSYSEPLPAACQQSALPSRNTNTQIDSNNMGVCVVRTRLVGMPGTRVFTMQVPANERYAPEMSQCLFRSSNNFSDFNGAKWGPMLVFYSSACQMAVQSNFRWRLAWVSSTRCTNRCLAVLRFVRRRTANISKSSAVGLPKAAAQMTAS